MTIYQRMMEIFRVADVPGFLQAWRKTDRYPEIPATYAVYNVTRARTDQSANDEAIFTRYDITIYLYGKTDITDAAEAITDALELGDFCISSEADLRPAVLGDYQYVRRIDVSYVDFGAYGKPEETTE